MHYNEHSGINCIISGNSRHAQPHTSQHDPSASPSLGSLPELTRSACVPFCLSESSWRSQSLCIAAWPRRAALLPIAALRNPSWPGRAEPPPSTRDPLALVEKNPNCGPPRTRGAGRRIKTHNTLFPSKQEQPLSMRTRKGCVRVWGGGGTCDM